MQKRNPKNVNRSVIPRNFPVGQIKYYDSSIFAALGTTPGYQDLTNIPQGSAQQQRVADTIFVDRIEVRSTFEQATSDVYNVCRNIIFAWKPNTASLTPGTTSIIEDPVTFIVWSPLNYEGRQEYHIIKDMLFPIVGTTSAPTNITAVTQIYTLRMKNHRVQYNKGVTTGTNHIFWMNLTTSAIAPHPMYNVVFRVWYRDT